MTSRRPQSARATYLRDLGDDVDRALELVVQDVVATNAMERDRAEAAVRIRADHHLEFVRSNGIPVSAQKTAVWVAEAVQEDLIKDMAPNHRSSSGPAAPTIPTTRCG